jgi:hypothetical protein
MKMLNILFWSIAGMAIAYSTSFHLSMICAMGALLAVYIWGGIEYFRIGNEAGEELADLFRSLSFNSRRVRNTLFIVVAVLMFLASVKGCRDANLARESDPNHIE